MFWLMVRKCVVGYMCLIKVFVFFRDDIGLSNLVNCMYGMIVLIMVMNMVVIWFCVKVDVNSLKFVEYVMKISVFSVSVVKLFLIGILNIVIVSSVSKKKFSMVSMIYGVCLLSINFVWVIGVM